jgi:hypothetical protein
LLYARAGVWVESQRDSFQPTRGEPGWVLFFGLLRVSWNLPGRMVP